MIRVLDVQNLSKAFGGNKAVNDVSFTVEPRSITALIGPNGAGKSTVLNLLSGNLRPDSGKILFEGEDLATLSIQEIQARGIGRSFQTPSVFGKLTALENVQSATLSQLGATYSLWGTYRSLARDEALEYLDYFNIAHLADHRADSLSHGDQRRLELAMCLALKPRLLLLDEPTQGLAIHETRAFMDLLEDLRNTRGLTILLVEHNMSVVFSISDSVVVMNRGQVLVTGTPDEIRNNATVKEVYLGDVS